MRTIRTTIEPGREIEVTEEEYTDLSRLGLIVSDEHTPEARASKNKKDAE